MFFLKQEGAEGESYEVLCKIFVLSQCALSITESDMLNFQERKWDDICLNYTKTPSDADTAGTWTRVIFTTLLCL